MTISDLKNITPYGVSLLAKEVGFDEYTSNMYSVDVMVPRGTSKIWYGSKVGYTNKAPYDYYFSAVPYFTLFRWLRDKYNIHINAHYTEYGVNVGWEYTILFDYRLNRTHDMSSFIDLNIPLCESYKCAVDGALIFVLKWLRIKNSEFAGHMNSIIERLNVLGKLHYNFDGYYASPPNYKCIGNVKRIIYSLPPKYIGKLNARDVTPSTYSTVLLEWYNDDYLVSVEIGEKSSGYYSEFRDKSNPYNDEWEISDGVVEELLNKLYDE